MGHVHVMYIWIQLETSNFIFTSPLCFLDFVPEKVKAEDALKARALAEPDDFWS